MKKALVVGVDYYDTINNLFGCVNDAYSVKSVIERNSDGTLNFDLKLVVSNAETSKITRKKLKDMVVELFSEDDEIALFYFAGHGYIDDFGGYLITSECSDGDAGLSMSELLTIVNSSKVKNKVIILDTCHSGALGNPDIKSGNVVINEGVTLLTATSKNQYAIEEKGSGIFTKLLVDALNGGAANLLGDITPGSVYAHIDQSLGSWQQRPIFKTNVKSFVSLRKVQAPISLEDLRMITSLFPEKGVNFQLDPTFEPESGNAKQENTEVFTILQKYNRLNLLVPVEAEHMYFAAMESKSCKLTVLGEHYWNLVKSNRI